jgi:S-adenosylmethionine hydrolase
MPNRIDGTVRSIDSFGNLVTDITAEMLAAAPRGEETTIRCDEHETTGIYRTYSDQPEMTLIALVGSSGYLELAIVGDSAATMLGVRVGEKVDVRW